MARDPALPQTMTAPETGGVLTRDVRPFVVTYKGDALTVALPGYYPAGTGEGLHVGRDMAVVDAALRILKARIDRHPELADELR